MTGQYKAVLFDEADWRLIASNKKLFQASVAPVQLGQSNCNRDAYEIFVHNMPIMICSNAFWKDCDDVEITEWIRQNCFYEWIDSNLFEGHPERNDNDEEGAPVILPLTAAEWLADGGLRVAPM